MAMVTAAAFIGGGRVTRILLGGWARAGALPQRVLVHDPDEKALESLAAAGVTFDRVSARKAAGADVVFIALHPRAISAALADLKGTLTADAVLVSLAPTITLSMLADAAGTPRVVRMIPNAPSLTGQGYNPVAYARAIDTKTATDLARLFAPWGDAPEVEEPHLEAYAILTAMGPTYFWHQWQALREVTVGFGLSTAETDRALRAMLAGSISTLLDAGLPPAAVMDLIPVKPLAEMAPAIEAAYRTRLPALHARIQPIVVA
jgi:pyrroline-5-carboxylate reductase